VYVYVLTIAVVYRDQQNHLLPLYCLLSEFSLVGLVYFPVSSLVP
jgi:hypothetical protein